MGKLFFFGLMFCSISLFSQTNDIEVKNLSDKFQRGEFDQLQYLELGKEWQNLISYFGEYPDLPFNEEKKCIEFSFISSFDAISKQKIYDRSIEWASINIEDARSSIRYQDFNSGKIIFKTNFDITYKKDVQTFFGFKLKQVVTRQCYQTFLLTMQEGKIKVEIVNIDYEIETGGYTSGNTYVPKSSYKFPIELLFPITDYEAEVWKDNLTIMLNTKEKLNKMVEDLFNYIRNYQSDYEF